MAFTAFAQQLPQDPSIRKGKLKNGMTYNIRHNAKEAGLADFYIAQRVGSILEEPRQRGLAHFLEHMAFNGTKNFPGKGKSLGIVPWCETIGVKFGANLNAYTSIDQTVYHIGSAPLKREGIIDSCLLVLHDWSHYLLLEDAEIDKERGVIHEEWRTRRAGMAVQRLQEQAMPKVYRGTKYEDCMPIGSMDIVDNFPYQDLRDYYQKWYRPDLQAIIVVGDIDVDKMERKIKKVFSPIPMPKNAAERIYYPVSDNDSMIVDIEKDKEQPIVLCHIYQKREATPDSGKNSAKYLRDNYVDVPFTPQSDLELDFLKRCLSIAYTDSVREEKGGTYGVSVDFGLDKDDKPNAMLKISYNADPQRYEELNPIVYRQLRNIADHGPSEASMQKVKEYLVKQYAQASITNDYWSYVIWHELDDDTDFDRDYCQMVQAMKPQDVQRMARQLLDAKRRIEVTMLSE